MKSRGVALIAVLGLAGCATATSHGYEPYLWNPACNSTRLDPPVFPINEFRYGFHGTATLAVKTVDCGPVIEVRLLASSGNRNLDEAALKSAKGWDMPFHLSQWPTPDWWSVQVSFPVPAKGLGTSQAAYDSTHVSVSVPMLIAEPR